MDTILFLVKMQFALVYPDDIVIASMYSEEYINPIIKVFTLMPDAGVTLMFENASVFRVAESILAIPTSQDAWQPVHTKAM